MRRRVPAWITVGYFHHLSRSGGGGARSHGATRPSIMTSLPFRIFPELSSTDMVVIIVKGMNLPAPTGKTKKSLILSGPNY